MNTVNAGSPDNQTTAGGMPWAAIIFGIVALLAAVFIGARVIGVLFALMAPPEPPTPPSSRLLDYSREAYGVDTWTYDTDLDTCQVVSVYLAHDGQCPIMPLRCAPDLTVEPEQSDDYIALCFGDVEFSIFAMRWQLAIPLRTAPGERLRFDVSRQVFWTGELPPPPH